MNQKTVRIPEELFVTMFKYIMLHYDEDDVELFNKIEQGIIKKLEAIKKHRLYTQYKTAKTPEEREKARNEYLDLTTILPDFRY